MIVPQAVVHIMKQEVEAPAVIQLLKLQREELELNKSRDALVCQQSQIMMTVLSKLAEKILKNEKFKGSLSILFVYVFELLIF